MVGAADCPLGAQFRVKKQSTDGKTTMPVAPAPAVIYDVDKEKRTCKRKKESMRR
ncbi:Uncharacterised protein [Janthinobacterium lividum]|nr:Uncharacterised protein [Janthinobacterium lividum]